MAVLINVNRRHFNEDVSLDWGQLPAGVRVDAPIIPKGQDRIPVVFHVDPNAKMGGHLLGVKGRATVGDKSVEGNYHQRTALIRGQNNRDVWGYDADRLAVGITQEAPYTIEAAVPSVPLVRNGSLPIVVTVKRKEGFKQPLKLNALHVPPGVAARRDVMLPADKDSVELMLTANGGALLAATPIAIVAEATHESVPYITSSELVEPVSYTHLTLPTICSV